MKVKAVKCIVCPVCGSPITKKEVKESELIEYYQCGECEQYYIDRREALECCRLPT